MVDDFRMPARAFADCRVTLGDMVGVLLDVPVAHGVTGCGDAFADEVPEEVTTWL